MLAVQIGIDEADGQRLDAAFGVQGLEIGLQGRLVQWRHHLTVGADPLAGTDGQLQRRQQRLLHEGHPAAQTAGAVRPRHLQRVFKAFGGHQPHGRALAGQHGIGRHGGAMHHPLDPGGINTGLLANPLHAVQYTDGAILRRARHLGGPGIPALLVDQQQVGECATYVYA